MSLAQAFGLPGRGMAKPGWWKWAIAVTASTGALMEVIDTSIVNVALTDMQGTLGATLAEIGWVVTGYAIANVIIIPLSAWLGDYYGKKSYFIFSLIGFVIASILCGFSTTLPMLVAARILQGLTGGGLLAKAQTIMLENFPKEEQGTAQAIFGLGVIIGPALGPTLGGFLTDNLGWRWIFFINIPFGILAVLASIIFLPENETNHQMNRRVDWLGIGFLTLWLGAFQTMLEEGQQDDWFASPFIWTMAILSAVGAVLFLWRELSIDYPAVNLRVLRYPSLAAGSVFSMILGMGLYGALFVIPIFAQTMLGFTATQTGLLLLPGSIASGVMMLVAGRVINFLDPRILVAIGSTILGFTMFSLAGINPSTSVESLYWPLIWRGLGTVLMFLPLTMATYAPIPKKDISAAAGFFNLTRQIGGSLGIAILTTYLAQREALHRVSLVGDISQYSPVAQERIQMLTSAFVSRGIDPVTAQQQAFAVLERTLSAQAAILSFGDIFRLVGVAFFAALLLVFFLGRKPAGAPIAPPEAH